MNDILKIVARRAEKILTDKSIPLVWEMEEYPKKIQAFLGNAERMLGTKEGELKEFLRMFGQMS